MKHASRFKKIVAPLLLATSACTHLFHNPDRFTYWDPKSEGYNLENVEVPNPDGSHLHGWLFHTQSPQVKNLHKTVVQFHGNAENISSFYKGVAWMTYHGYDVFVFDYRGYGKSQGRAAPEFARQDAISVIHYLNQRIQNHQTDKLIVFGQSLGGAIALDALEQIALQDSKQLNGIEQIIIEGSFVNYKKIASEKLNNVFITWPFQWLAYLLISNDYSPANHIESIKSLPVLVIHGTNDITVPIHHGRELYQLVQGKKEFWQIPGGRHIDTFFEGQKENRLRLIHWLQQKAVSSN